MNYWPGYPQTSSPGYDEGLINLPRQATCAYLQQIPKYPKGGANYFTFQLQKLY
ncbi:hypothetical protein [Alkaliphilus peptidifermentans]|uniref:hypothetical protein n=1 Tax=Alkaliphilus peptidifermentans TaxID=426129 RepID=UPI0015A2D07A|nr:hypothetical protein [Alkaliphilus peptidifermentans]